MAIAPVLKTGARKGLGVRVPHPPFLDRSKLRWGTQLLSVVCTIAVISVNASAQQTRLVDAIKMADSLRRVDHSPKTLQLAWRIYLAASQFEKALTVADELIRVDSAMADTAFYIRNTAAAAAISPTRAAEVVKLGLSKYPDNVTLLVLQATILQGMAQSERALLAVNRALAIESRVPEGYVQKALILNTLNEPDSVLAMIRLGRAHFADNTTLAQIALKTGSDSYRNGSVSKRREELQRAVDLLLLSNELSFSTDAKFLAGSSAFLIGRGAFSEADAKKDCALARLARKSFATAQENVPAGLQAYHSTALRLLKELAPLLDASDKQIQRFCK